MVKSLTKIFQIATNRLEGPEEWNVMTIKSTHKKGTKLKMPNKRGLFLTNIVGKIFERVIKSRNKISYDEALSPNQTGGKRSIVDNVMVELAVIERNTYLNKTTYLTSADVSIDYGWRTELKTCGCVE